jgi:hypothetical protein
MIRVSFISLSLCLLLGCGQHDVSDIDRAGPALRTALEAWKGGKSQDDLANQSPSITMNEDDWREGKILLDYTLEDQGAMKGRQVVWRAQIKLQDKSGKTEDRRATYVIDTTPQMVIVRDRFAR